MLLDMYRECVCMCVCTHVCMCACVYACAYTYIIITHSYNTHTRARARTHTHTHTYIQACAHTQAHLHFSIPQSALFLGYFSCQRIKNDRLRVPSASNIYPQRNSVLVVVLVEPAGDRRRPCCNMLSLHCTTSPDKDYRSCSPCVPLKSVTRVQQSCSYAL